VVSIAVHPSAHLDVGENIGAADALGDDLLNAIFQFGLGRARDTSGNHLSAFVRT
jgi:hypothetical protein